MDWKSRSTSTWQAMSLARSWIFRRCRSLGQNANVIFSNLLSGAYNLGANAFVPVTADTAASWSQSGGFAFATRTGSDAHRRSQHRFKQTYRLIMTNQIR